MQAIVLSSDVTFPTALNQRGPQMVWLVGLAGAVIHTSGVFSQTCGPSHFCSGEG